VAIGRNAIDKLSKETQLNNEETPLDSDHEQRDPSKIGQHESLHGHGGGKKRWFFIEAVKHAHHRPLCHEILLLRLLSRALKATETEHSTRMQTSAVSINIRC
jgi:hypothetical protein